MAAPSNRYLGKFRGRVVSNDDPLRIGRITVEVPDVLGNEPSTWALPCLPFTGPESGQFVVPPPGAGVWVEFEQGDPSFPVWTGCWYGAAEELPPDARRELQGNSPNKPVVVQTPQAHKLVMNDTAGAEQGILLQAQGGAYIRITREAVVISTGAGAEILLRGNEVTINEGQLTVLSKR
ncbi:phage baseplate assembly protein V [Streptomyces sp. HUAS 31]|uniref:Baseplate assembly protein n=1 Tax=Streptomyces chartreusis TaxID=1969 RepID=A0A7H8TJ02_STRCX|nr:MULTISPECIES: phage baseplate assembly protein V [Streptomyces]QEV71889.1 baseplate assembly protein [Streptomyces chartreusis]QKZ23385.1 baseplate assembly protein [Streptomyces chartreusis]RSN96020.1 baseplate assembly protein [Streptomyces sp. WAC 05379]WCD95095.1 phage baseplate assembly protein V [Streptomyces sp. HUAS 31]GGX22539.1 baseplate assembly protein [Streptomyces chartreusis]